MVLFSQGNKLNTATGAWEMKLWFKAKGTGAGDSEDEDDEDDAS